MTKLLPQSRSLDGAPSAQMSCGNDAGVKFLRTIRSMTAGSAHMCWVAIALACFACPLLHSSDSREKSPAWRLAQPPRFASAALSPDGTNVALVGSHRGKWRIEIHSTMPGAAPRMSSTDRGMDFSRVEWIDDNHLLCWVGLHERYFLGTWVLAIGGERSGQTWQVTDWGAAHLVHVRRGDRPRMIFASNPNDSKLQRLYQVSLDANFDQIPTQYPCHVWLLDDQGELRVGLDLTRGKRGFWFGEKPAGPWQYRDLDFEILPLGVASDGRGLVALAPDDNGYLSCRRFDPQTAELGEVLSPAESRDVLPWSMMRGPMRTALEHASRNGQLLGMLDPHRAALSKNLKVQYPDSEMRIIDHHETSQTALVWTIPRGGSPRYDVIKGNPPRVVKSFIMLPEVTDLALTTPMDVTFTGSTGFRTHGRLFPPVGSTARKSAIVIPRCDPFAYSISSHESSDGCYLVAHLLAQHGIAVLAIDPEDAKADGPGQRRHPLAGTELANAWIEQTLNAAEWLVREGHADDLKHVGLLGDGLGGTITALAAADPRLGAAVIVNGFLNLNHPSKQLAERRDWLGIHSADLWYPAPWPGSEARDLSPITTPRRSQIPTLVIHGSANYYSSISYAKRYVQTVRRENRQVYLQLLDGNTMDIAHILAAAPNRLKLFEALVDFVREHLQSAPPHEDGRDLNR